MAGSPELWVALHQHPFGRGFLQGLLAGLIPLEVWLSISGFFSADIPEFLKKMDLERMKIWVVAIFSPIMVMVLFTWLMDWYATHSKRVTVLQESSSLPPISTLFEGFFSTNCRNVSDIRLDLWGDNFLFHCAIHIQLISVFLMTAGYSLAPVIRAHLQPTQMREHEESAIDSGDEAEPESKMAESTEKQ
jgi:hypothetical protein